MFESLFGYLPFEPKGGLTLTNLEKISNPEEELQCLLRRKVEIPEYASEHTSSFIASLLELEPEKRLGGGPASEGLDINGLKGHPYFFGLEGPLATSISWDKVLEKQYTPVFLPKAVHTFKREKRHYANFEALLRNVHKAARKKAKRQAKRKGQETLTNIATQNEGQPLTNALQHYFDNWDYVCPEAVRDELLHEKEVASLSQTRIKVSRVKGYIAGIHLHKHGKDR